MKHGLAARSGYAGVVFAAVSWGMWPLFLRQVHAAGPVAAQLCSFVVMLTMALTLCPLALRATRQRELLRPAKEWWLLGAFGLSDALNCVLYFAALQTTSVAVAVLTHYLAPLIVALGAPLVLGERRRPGTFVAVAIGLFGLTVLLAPWEVRPEPAGTLVTGALLGLGSAVFYGANVLFSKRLSRSFEASEMQVYHMPTALLLLALMVPAGGWVASAPALGWLFLGAIGPGALAGVVFMRSLARVPAAHASVLTLVEPFAALAVAALVLGETLAPSRLIGGAAILGAGYLVVREGRPAPLGSALTAPPPHP